MTARETQRTPGWKLGRDPWQQRGKDRFAAIVHMGPDERNNAVIHASTGEQAHEWAKLFLSAPALLAERDALKAENAELVAALTGLANAAASCPRYGHRGLAECICRECLWLDIARVALAHAAEWSAK